MSSENAGMHAFVLQQCQKAGFPCIPDMADPVVSIKYIVEHWCGNDSKNALAEYQSTARARGIVCATIKRHDCIRLSDAAKLVTD